MKSVNEVILLGNVGKDAEVREVGAEKIKVATFTLATSEGGYKRADGTDVPERTQWHNVVAWRGLAVMCERYVKKGVQLFIRGQIVYRQYESDGVKKYATDIIAEDISLCGARTGGESRPQVGAEDAPPPPPHGERSVDDLPF